MNKIRKLIVRVFGKKKIKIRQIEVIEYHAFFYGLSTSLYAVGNRGEIIRKSNCGGFWEFKCESGSVKRANDLLLIICAGHVCHNKESLNARTEFARVCE